MSSSAQSTVAAHPLFERQIALEAEMAARGIDAFKKEIHDAKANHQEANTSYGSYLVRRAIKPLADEIQAFLDKANSGVPGKRHVAVKYLRGVNPEITAFLTLRTCLNLVSVRITLQNASIKVADALESEAALAQFEAENQLEYKKATSAVRRATNERYKRVVYSYIAGKNEITLPQWAKRDKLLIGQKLIEMMIDTTGYFEILADYSNSGPVKRSSGLGYTYHLVGSPKCLEWVDKMSNYTGLAGPEYLPTILPPRPWTSPSEGGYYTLFKPLKLVKTGRPNYMEELSMLTEQMPVMYEAVNAMQETGYRINAKVQEVMSQLWETGGDVAGLPNREGYALPRCPICGEIMPMAHVRGVDKKHRCFTLPGNEEKLKSWKVEAAKIYDLNIATMSKRFQFAKTLWLADKFKGEAAIYFPMQLDFRGRCYAVPSYLNPQGADPAKGLLLFSEGKPLTTPEAIKWLAVHGSNVWGNDKVSLEDRHAWVLENEGEILAVAENPYDNRMWFEADKPWQFLAFCFEWAGHIKEGATFVSHLPVAMDGTCNGLQIFSLMLRDPVGGAATNLLPADKPQDIYQIVADKTTLKLQEKSATGRGVYRKGEKKEDPEIFWYDEKDMALALLTLGINRKTTKRQVMVLPYGGTFQSCCEYTLEHLNERLAAVGQTPAGINDQNVYAASRFLAALIWDSIGETVVAAREAMGFLQKLASVVAAEGLPVNWTTPVGFLVSQAYHDLKEYRVKTRLGASIIRMVLRDEGEIIRIDKRRQRNGISPNFVHSLDAAAMCLSISLARKRGVTSFMMIHDSYGTHAADAPALASSLRRAFVSMFTERDVLADLKQEIAEMLPEKRRKELPDLPAKGTLDVNEVLKSTFFFA